ncbi:MAG: hypothetical protein ACFBZ8_13825 [Opitutales bacterium]
MQTTHTTTTITRANARRLRRGRTLAALGIFAALLQTSSTAADIATSHETYDLRGPFDWTGRTLTKTSSFRINEGQFFGNIQGNKIGLTQNVANNETRRVRIRHMDGPHVTYAEVTVLESQELMTMTTQAGQLAQREETVSPLLDRSIRIRRTGSGIGYNFELVGEAPDFEQIAAMEELAFPADPGIPFPEKPVAIGESWSVTGNKLNAFLDMAEDNLDGEAQLTLLGVEQVAGETIAIVDIQLRFITSTAGKRAQDFEGAVEMNASGTIERNLALSINRLVRLVGTMSVKGQVVEGGEIIGRIASTGPFTIEQTESLN